MMDHYSGCTQLGKLKGCDQLQGLIAEDRAGVLGMNEDVEDNGNQFIDCPFRMAHESCCLLNKSSSFTSSSSSYAH